MIADAKHTDLNSEDMLQWTRHVEVREALRYRAPEQPFSQQVLVLLIENFRSTSANFRRAT